MARRFSIRYKFLAVTTLLLVVCLGAYLFMASREFKSDKTQLVFDLNRSNVTNLASELEGLFRGAADKVQLIAYFFRGASQAPKAGFLEGLLSGGSEIVFAAGSERFSELDREFFVDAAFLETYGLTREFFTESLPSRRPIPFDRIRAKGEAIWNATVENGPPLLGFGKSVVEEDALGRPLRQYAVITLLKADRILKALNQSQLSEVFVTNADGELLAHYDSRLLSRRFKKTPRIVEMARASNVKTSVVEYRDGSEEILGAYSKAYNDGVLVLSRVSGRKAFAVVDRLVQRSLMLAGILVTLAFIFATGFSRSLTRPIEVLVGGMKQVADGDLETRIRVRSRDEIAWLADSFNAMIGDLRDSRQKLEEINRDLENKVRERTLELEKQNLAVKQAQEALLRTTRLAAVGEIAGQAAHEVLNPLTSILSRLKRVQDRLHEKGLGEVNVLGEIVASWEKDYGAGGFEKLISAWQSPSSVLDGKSLWEEDLENLRRVEVQLRQEVEQLTGDTDFLSKEGQRINRIVTSMRSLSVVRAEFKSLSARALARQSIDIMADLATQYDTRIVFHDRAESDAVMVHEDEIIQVLTNLLRNALQSIGSRSERRPGVIDVTVSNEGDRVLIEVTDNGVGIAEEHRERLFETNFTTKSRADGSGLGLKISRRFIRAFHGDLTLRWTEADRGAAFVISLPRADATTKAGLAAA